MLAELNARLPSLRQGSRRTVASGKRMTAARVAWTVLPPLAVCGLLAGWIVLMHHERAGGGLLAVRFRHRQPDRLHRCAGLCAASVHAPPPHRGGGRCRWKAAAWPNLSINLAALVPPDASRVPVSRFAIIASVFNLEDQLEEFMQAFGRYRERVWLISDGSTDNTVLRLRQAGWRCFDDGINRRKPGAIRRLLEWLPAHIETVMVIDPDIRIRGLDEGSSIDLERFVSDFQQSGRRRGLSAHHDRAGRLPGALPVVRVRAGVPGRAGRAWRISASPPASPSTGATRSQSACWKSTRCRCTPRISRTR